MHDQEQSRLLQLPTELQLAIFEYAVIENSPLLLNCGCDSSYNGLDDPDKAWRDDQALWESGEKHPPVQPGLTQTCKLVRAITLPMFYQKNVFRAHYCYAAKLPVAVQWLKTIGNENRLLLRDIALWDMNPSFDTWVPKDIKIAKRSEIARGMGGRLEKVEVRGCCFHRVVFGRSDDDYLDSVSGLFGDGLETEVHQSRSSVIPKGTGVDQQTHCIWFPTKLSMAAEKAEHQNVAHSWEAAHGFE